jgi:predicted SprT family Zn-dependent metalloprotease
MSTVTEEFARLQAQYPSALGGWRIEVSARLTASAGICYHQSKIIRIAEWLVLRAPKNEIVDTVRHEVAHALLSKDEGHGEPWRIMAQQVGAVPTRCYDSSLLGLAARSRP